LLFSAFYPRDAVPTLYLLSSCVRLSVCPSVTSRCSTKMAKPRITQTTPYDIPVTLVFNAGDLGEITTGPLQTGAPNRGGVG